MPKRDRIPDNSVGDIGLSPKDRLEQTRRLVKRVFDGLTEYLDRYEGSHSYSEVKGDDEYKELAKVARQLEALSVPDSNDEDDVDDDDEDEDDD